MRRRLLLALGAVLLAGCATDGMRSRQRVLEDTLRAYASVIRWGDVAQAQSFIDPKIMADHPPTALELARFKQVHITTYDEQPATPAGKDEVRQTVEIGLVNNNTLIARSVTDRQVWRYDETAKRWWLTSGLPDITHQQ